MKNVILFAVILLLSIRLIAQPDEGFSSDPAQFSKEISKFLKDTKREDCKTTADNFAANIKDSKFTDTELENIVRLCNLMLKSKMRAFPHFENLIRACNYAPESMHADKLNLWISIVSQSITDAKRGDKRPFQAMVDFGIGLFGFDVIYFSNTEAWKAEPLDFDLDIKEGTPVVNLNEVTLIGYTKADTVRIENTSGTYFPLTNEWLGKKGMITWEQYGFSASEVSAGFKHHRINLSKSDFEIDSVTFHYKDLFKGPVKGLLEHKLLLNKTSKSSRYPRFLSYENTLEVKNILPRVDYVGGFEMRGPDIMGAGAGGGKASLLFYPKEGKDTLAIARSKTFVIGKEDVASSVAEIIIKYDKDSIYHPGMNLKFRNDTRILTLSKGEHGLAKSNFFDSYHQLEYDVERVIWQIDEPEINMSMLVGGDLTPAYFESANLFEKRKFEKYQAVTPYNAIGAVRRTAEFYNTRQVSAHAVAREFHPNLTVDQIRGTLYSLVEEGFIYYDQEEEIVTVKDKTYNYVYANGDLIDYDIIKMKSISRVANATFDLLTGEMEVNGVYNVGLSQSQFVNIFPRGRSLKVLQNRDMLFSGTVFGGKIDFFGVDYLFSYGRFDIRLDNLDSMTINIPGDEVDEFGSPKLIPVKTVFENLNGTLYIDAPENKSGRIDYPEYPKFENIQPSYAYYDRKGKYKKVYDRERFYFEIDPFVIDSLDNFKFESQKFTGTFHSAGIFPPFRERLFLRDDRSMGFVSTTPPEGYDLYGGKGTYYNTIDLSNKGLIGRGKVEYMATTSSSRNIIFLPDSMLANVDRFTIAQTKTGANFPEVENDSVFVNWKPGADSMAVNMGKNPFRMFGNIADLSGNLLVSNTGLKGSGLLDWEEATLKSKDFAFGHSSVHADSSRLRIKSIDQTKVAFTMPNVRSDVDFEKKTGHFISNEKEVPTAFPYNQYETSFYEFDWDMTARLINFLPPKERPYADFLSVHPKQDSLRFKAKGGIYDLNDFVIKAYDVPYIAVADAHVIPGDGKVEIEPDAVMRELMNAEIFIDSLKRTYKIYNANVNIFSRDNFRGAGDYDYVNRSGSAQAIRFDDIGVKGRRKAEDTLYTYATGTIPPEQQFELDPKIRFTGQSTLHSKQAFLNFKGISLLKIKDSLAVKTDWFRINQPVNPVDVVMNVNQTVGRSNDSLITGIHQRADSTNMYATLIGRKIYRGDKTAFQARGKLKFDPKSNEYVVGTKDKMMGNSTIGNMLKYNNNDGSIYAEGKTDLGLDFKMVTMDGAGVIERMHADSSFTFDMILGFNIYFTKEILNTMYDDIMSLTFSADDIDYYRENFQHKYKQLMRDEEEADQLINNLDMTGQLPLPEGKNYTLMLTDVKLEWDPATKTYRAAGNMGLAMLNGKNVGKEIKVYLELGSRRTRDYLNIYLESESEDWYYINYQTNVIRLLSSNVNLNHMVLNTKIKHRRYKTKKGFVSFTIGTPFKKNRFVKDMSFWESGGVLPDD